MNRNLFIATLLVFACLSIFLLTSCAKERMIPSSAKYTPIDLGPTQQKGFNEYDSYMSGHFKAFAREKNGTSWGSAWGYTNPKYAIEAAIRECKYKAVDCELYAIGEHKVAGLNNEQLSKAIRRYYEKRIKQEDISIIKQKAMNSDEIRQLLSNRQGNGGCIVPGGNFVVKFMNSGNFVRRWPWARVSRWGAWWTENDRLCFGYRHYIECFFVVKGQNDIVLYDEEGGLISWIRMQQKID